jgi:hypothetical protein
MCNFPGRSLIRRQECSVSESQAEQKPAASLELAEEVVEVD